MIVDDADIMHYLIMKFYGFKNYPVDYPEWKFILEVFTCRNYLCLEMMLKNYMD